MFLVNTWLKITDIFRIKAIKYHQTSLLLTAREVTYRILYLVATQILKNYSMTGGGIHPLSPIACHLGPSKNSYPKLPGLIIEKQPNSSGPRYFFWPSNPTKRWWNFSNLPTEDIGSDHFRCFIIFQLAFAFFVPSNFHPISAFSHRFSFAFQVIKKSSPYVFHHQPLSTPALCPQRPVLHA